MSHPVNEIVATTLSLYSRSLKRASGNFIKTWPLNLGAIAAFFFFQIAAGFIQQTPGAGASFSIQGFILGALFIALVSLYYRWLSVAVEGRKLTFKEMLEFDAGLFWSTMGAGFVLFIINLVVSSIFPPQLGWAIGTVNFGMFMLLNSLSESIYIERADGMDSLRRAVGFVRDNWIEWFLPLLLLLIPLITVVKGNIIFLLAGGNVLVPPLVVVQAVDISFAVFTKIGGITATIIAVTFANWFMIFRGVLYKELYRSSRSQRIFKARSR